MPPPTRVYAGYASYPVCDTLVLMALTFRPLVCGSTLVLGDPTEAVKGHLSAVGGAWMTRRPRATR